jgi:hypothetical protein
MSFDFQPLSGSNLRDGEAIEVANDGQHRRHYYAEISSDVLAVFILSY